jgi:phospholipid transport system substrate-binding protein
MHGNEKSCAGNFSGRIRSSAVRFQLGLLIIALIVAGSTSAFATAEGSEGGPNKPEALVMGTVTQAIQILGDHQISREARRQRLIHLVAGHFDFADMARSSLGYHWRQLTPDQRQRFVQLFTAFIEDAYLSKLEGYSNQKIKFVDTASNGPGDSEVKTLVVQPNSDGPIRLDYRLKQERGTWKVYDVTVDGISITANYRNQFNHVINSQGFDVLMKKMQSKQQELLASLGK